MKIKLFQEPPDWSHLFRHKAHELKGELLEMALGYFIGFEFVHRAVAYIHLMFVDDFVALLHGNNNAIGILRVLLPLLLFLTGYCLRRIAIRLTGFVKRGFRRVHGRWRIYARAIIREPLAVKDVLKKNRVR